MITTDDLEAIESIKINKKDLLISIYICIVIGLLFLIFIFI
jgi:hypothetical protein